MAKSFLSIGKPRLEFSNVDPVQDVKTTMDFGLLYPVCLRECVPGDKIRYGVESIVRLNPTYAPVMHKMEIRFEAFFVPNRLVWDKWEEFITGGEDGEQAPEMPLHDQVFYGDEPTGGYSPIGRASLWNAFGLPSAHNSTSTEFQTQGLDYYSQDFVDWYELLTEEQRREITPTDLPFRAYMKIWNDFYRDENKQDEVDFTQLYSKCFLKSRCWTKNDYFTSALPFVLRGLIPSLSFAISGLTASTDIENGFSYLATLPETKINDTNSPGSNAISYVESSKRPVDYATPFNISGLRSFGSNADGKNLSFLKGIEDVTPTGSTDPEYEYSFYGAKNDSVATTTIDSSNVQSTIQASDIRWLMQVQKFLERNARGGSRYVEQVLSHFGVYTGDYRLQRPEFLGSTKSPIIVSEIPQTSAQGNDTTPQGNLAGRGLGAVSSNFVKYRVKEHGYFMVLASITPRLSYNSQGVNKSWIKRTRYDYYFPEFSHLTEQPIKKSEVFLKNTVDSDVLGDSLDTNFTEFGFSGIYNEYRTFPDQINGLMRSDFMDWHLARDFDKQPSLNSNFLSVTKNWDYGDISLYTPQELKNWNYPLNRILATPSAPPFIVDICNICHMYRPIPALAEPGLVDHF